MKPLSKPAQRAAAQILPLLLGLPADDAEQLLLHLQTQLEQASDDLPHFARGIAGPLGKLDNELKTKVDEVTHALYIRLCAMHQTDPSRDLRNYVYLRVHGKTYDAMVLERVNHDAQRTAALAALLGPFGAPETTGAQP